MNNHIEQVKRLIEASGKTRYRIYKDTGIDQGSLSRLMSGQRGLGFETLKTLVEYLGYEIVIRPKQKKGR